ncbi:MAG: hypothetical protein ACK4K7_00500 [Allosphingosinicella sp.]|uniref:hypothetical protein n=1 Tax=Allosphingosinicella sp. TaxID=2823234 RepID=UPI0039482769
MRPAIFLAAMLAAGAAGAAAQERLPVPGVPAQSIPGPPVAGAPNATAVIDAQTRTTVIEVYGTDPCPASGPDEIIVCARKPEEERFRIPENFRENPQRRVNESWAINVQELQYVGREGPMSCSTTGPNGITGCWEEMMRQARNDQRVDPQGQPIP